MEPSDVGEFFDSSALSLTEMERYVIHVTPANSVVTFNVESFTFNVVHNFVMED